VYCIWLQGHKLTDVLRGSNLFGVLTWTEQHLIRSISLTNSFICWVRIGSWSLLTLNQTYDIESAPEISALQPYPLDLTSFNIARLMLWNPSPFPAKAHPRNRRQHAPLGCCIIWWFWGIRQRRLRADFWRQCAVFCIWRVSDLISSMVC
jgi:hypothetical protein